LRKTIKRLRSSMFVRHVAVLATGTAIAQVITIAASPILSRLYDPTAFGFLAVIMSLAGPLSMIASWKYELAILLPKDDADAANVFVLCVIVILGMTVATAVIAFSLGGWIALKLGSPEAAPLLYLLPLMFLLGGVHGVAEHWLTRRKAFSRQATAEVLRSLTIVFGQIVGGLLRAGGTGLVLGRFSGSIVGLLFLAGQVWRQDGKFISGSIRYQQIRRMASEYSVFPKYNMPRAGLRAFSINMAPILLAFLFNPAAAGLFWFTYRLLQMPTALIGDAVRRVFYQRAIALCNENKRVLPFWKKTALTLMAIGAVPTLIVVGFGPSLFEFVFGPEWRQAGHYAQWLVVSWYFTFVNVPCSTLIPVFRLQPFFLGYEIVATNLRALMIVLGYFLGSDVAGIALYSILSVVLVLFMEFYVLRHIKSQGSKDAST
jgi:lipopolysaccharide exporter